MSVAADEGIFDDERLAVIARRVRTLRELHGKTQDTLAEASGVSDRTIKNVEAGKKVALDTYAAIAGTFNVSLSHLMRPDLSGEINFLGLFLKAFMETNHDVDFPKPKDDGLVNQIFQLDHNILTFINDNFLPYQNRNVLFSEAIGRYLKIQLDEYMEQLHNFGMPYEQALAFMHLFYINLLHHYTMKTNAENAVRLTNYYRELFDRLFPKTR